MPHTVNTVKRFDTTELNGAAVSFTVDSQLLDYVEPARTFGAGDLAQSTAANRYQPTIIAIPDLRPDTPVPMILSTGSQQRLQLIRRVENGEADLPAGFETVDLSETFAHLAAGTVRAFYAAWTQDDRVTLAVALNTKLPNGPSQILIAYDVNTRDNDWKALPWVDYGTRDALKIDGIRITQDADGSWLTLMSGSSGVLADAYVIRQSLPGSFQDAGMVFSTPFDVIDIADFQLGGVDGDAALHVLGSNHDGERLLVTRKVPVLDEDGDLSSPPFFSLNCPPGTNVIATGNNRPNIGSDLYTGGRGVKHLAAEHFNEQYEAVFETVIPESQASGIERLLVSESADGALTVWALDGTGRLWLNSRPAPETEAASPWGTPISLRRGVRDIAAVPGDVALSAAVLVIYDRGNAGSLVRDAQGIWQDEPITIADPASASKVLAFQTVVALRNAHGMPATGTLRLSASVPSTIVLNGHSHFVYPGNDVTLDIPADGKVRLSNRALSFSPATYRLDIDRWTHAIDINPACSLYQRFETLSADDLRHAQGTDGKPLLDEAYRSGPQAASLDALVASLKQATELSTSKAGGTDGVWLVARSSEFSSRVAADALPENYSWGLAADGKGSLQPLNAADASQLESKAGRISSGTDDNALSLSDIWESIANAVKDAVRFVIRKAADVVEFICEIGGKIARFIVNTLEEIGGLFKWLWNVISVAAEDAWNFLKFLFNWDDIIAVRNSMRDLVEAQLKAVKQEVIAVKPIVSELFNNGIRKVQDWKGEFNFPSSRPVDQQQAQESRKNSEQVYDGAVNSSSGSWIMDAFENVARSLIKIDLPSDTGVGTDFLTVFDRQLETLSVMSKDIGAAIRNIFPGGISDLADLTVEKLTRAVFAIVLNIAETALTIGRDLCLAMLDIVAALVDTFRAILFARISSPLIEKLWELVSGEKKDLSFSMIDFILLPPAVISTITFKLVFPKVDIRDATAVGLPVEGVAGAQSADWKSDLAYALKDIALGSYAYYSIVSGSIDSIVNTVTQGAGGTFSKYKKWLFWGIGFGGHLITPAYATYKYLNGDKKRASAGARAFEKLAWWIVLKQHWTKGTFYYATNNKMDHLDFLGEHRAFAAHEFICTLLHMFLKGMAVIASEEGEYKTPFVIQYYCNSGAKAINAASQWVDEPLTKGTMNVLAIVSGMAGFVIGTDYAYNTHKQVIDEYYEIVKNKGESYYKIAKDKADEALAQFNGLPPPAMGTS